MANGIQYNQRKIFKNPSITKCLCPLIRLYTIEVQMMKGGKPMRRIIALFALLFTLALPSVSLADARALLIACSDFVTQPDLGSAISGNVQMIASALLGISPRLAGLSIEDGTIGTAEALDAAIGHAFSEANEDDLSILYLCTHGILSSSDDDLAYLLLSDGEAETTLSGSDLCRMLAPIQGDKLVILDACYSGALIGRGANPIAAEPFLLDTSIHVLTSAAGHESSWYYDSDQLSAGAISYFASALSSGLGLYGAPEADINSDGQISLRELHQYLNAAVPSSSCQLMTADDTLSLPTVSRAMLSRPLSGFAYGESLLSAEQPAFDFSFTVTSETTVQYRLIDFDEGKWNWENAKTFLDSGDDSSGQLTPGRKNRTLMLTEVAPSESGYLMLQVFSLTGDELVLCSEQLIAVQPAQTEAALSISAPSCFTPGGTELAISIHSAVPAEITVSVHDAHGSLIRRICQSHMTRPSPDNMSCLYWDGRNQSGTLVSPGLYTITAEAYIGTQRVKVTSDVTLF